MRGRSIAEISAYLALASRLGVLEKKLMRRSVFASLLVVIVWGFLALPAQAQDYTIQPVTLTPTSGLSTALFNLLDPQGTRLIQLMNGRQFPQCDVWWSKSISTEKNAAASARIVYGNVKPGTLVGVVRYLTKGDDFRDVDLKPGFYTMRYGRIPADGSDGDDSPYRDFAFLIPALADTEIQRSLSTDEVLKLSRLVSGTRDPAILSLVPVNPAYKKFPSVVTDDQGHCTLQVRLRELPAGSDQGEETPLAILLVVPHSDLNGS